MTDAKQLVRSLSSSNDPADWGILADWHEDHGNTDDAARWRRRARVGQMIIDRLLPLAPEEATGIEEFGRVDTVWLGVSRRKRTVVAKIAIWDGIDRHIYRTTLVTVRICPVYLCRVHGNRLNQSSHLARALRKLVDAVLD